MRELRRIADQNCAAVVHLQQHDHLLELVGDVDLVRVEHEHDHVGARREPAHHLEEVVRALLLLLPREHARRVDERRAAREVRRHLAPREALEERVAELAELVERRLRVRDERVPRQRARLVAVHDRLEAVRRRLRPDVHARELHVEEVLDERRLARRILADEQHERLRVKVLRVEQRVVEVVDQVLLLERADLLGVDRLAAVDDAVELRGVELGLLAAEHPALMVQCDATVRGEERPTARASAVKSFGSERPTARASAVKSFAAPTIAKSELRVSRVPVLAALCVRNYIYCSDLSSRPIGGAICRKVNSSNKLKQALTPGAPRSPRCRSPPAPPRRHSCRRSPSWRRITLRSLGSRWSRCEERGVK